jgi:hypothetical protein
VQDTELFLSLAEIAGVFVGFGALIAVRAGGPTAANVVAPMRGMVTMGAMTIVAALAPVILGRYGLTGHGIWALSSVVVLVGFFGTMAAMARTPEYRATWAAEIEAGRTTRSRWLVVVESAAYAALMIALVLIPILILLAVAPELEAALYSTVVALLLIGAGWTLLGLVFSPSDPKIA